MTRASVRLFLAVGLAAALLAAAPAQAGGPMFVNLDGRPFVWDNTRPIPYTLDAGPFGIFSNQQAAQWVADAFAAWAGVEGVQLSFQPTAPHSVDITGRNVLQQLDSLPDTVSLLILDHDGSVLDTLFGAGFSDEFEGIGMPTLFDFQTGKIVQARAILSGKNTRRYRPEWIRGALIEHELGHFLGLTHSQLNPEVQFDGDATNDHLAPRMSYNEGPNDLPHLHLEDRAWIAFLYPKPGAARTTGVIRGRVLFPDGATGLQGIQVVARRDGDEQATAVSCISGYRFKDPHQGTGSRDLSLWGLYELPGLPPGTYRIAIEQLTDSPTVHPVHAFLPGGRRFWKDARPLAAQPVDATLVSVEAGQVVEGKDFVLDGPTPVFAQVRGGDLIVVPEMAQTIPHNAVVTGRAGPQDPGILEVPLGGGRVDVIEDFYRVVVTEPTTLTATLVAINPAADLQLYLIEFGQEASTLVPLPIAASVDRGTPPETFQVRVPPGVYFIGVSSHDATSNPTSDYRLTLLSTPSPELPVAAPTPPRITLATVSHLTQTGLRVSWRTDQDANAVLLVERPLREFGSPTLARERSFAVTSLARGTFYSLELFSRNAEGALFGFPPLLLNTPIAASGTTPFLSVGLSGAQPQDAQGREFLLFARISNWGNGVASNTTLTRMALPRGWRFVEPPPLPLDLGQIGVRAYALVAVLATREAADAAPLDLAIQGTYAMVDGSIRAFGQ